MARSLTAVLLSLVMMNACVDDTVALQRGRLGPSRYDVSITVTGGPAVATGSVSARLDIDDRPSGATLHLRIEDEAPIIAELRRDAGRFELVTVQGVSPGSAGEADLASLVSQLDPPLSPDAVRLGERWSSTRTFETDSLQASLRTDLRLVRFQRAHGTDVAELEGDIAGTLSTSGTTGVFSGRVDGTTRILWGISDGRLVASDVSLRWRIRDAGNVSLETSVRPA